AILADGSAYCSGSNEKLRRLQFTEAAALIRAVQTHEREPGNDDLRRRLDRYASDPDCPSRLIIKQANHCQIVFLVVVDQFRLERSIIDMRRHGGAIAYDVRVCQNIAGLADQHSRPGTSRPNRGQVADAWKAWQRSRQKLRLCCWLSNRPVSGHPM